MTTVYQYRVRIVAPPSYAFIWGTSPPTVGPNGETIDTSLTVIVQTVTSNTLNEDFTFDAFQRLRIGNPFTVLSLKQTADDVDLFYDDQQTSGAGTGSTYSQNRASTTLSVSNATAGTRVFQSKLRGVYQPGLSLDCLLTGVIGAGATGITKNWGYFDNNNGLFFQSLNNILYVVRRTFVTGAPVDTKVAQADWNIDTMDGNGPSGLTLDVTESNIYGISFEWLGVGQVTFSVNINGITYPIHQINNANNLNVVYMSNPNLPIRYEISNSGSGPASTLETICASIISNGGNPDSTKTTYISREGTLFTLGATDTYYPILSVRLKANHVSTRADIKMFGALMTTNDRFQCIVILNPTLTGTDTASWTPITNSSLEYDISRTNALVVDPNTGYKISGIYGGSGTAVRTATGSDVNSFLTLGSNIDGTVDQMILAVANIDAAGGQIYGSMTFTEFP